MTTEERFWSKVAKQDGDGCWEWTGGLFKDGYGGFGVDGKVRRAHRVSFEMHNGWSIPAGLLITHSCDNRKCVRPSHLFINTNAGNLAEMAQKDRSTFGVRNARAKLTDVLVQSMRSKYASGNATLIELAEEFGVKKSTVHAIVTGVIWKRLPCPRPIRMRTRWSSKATNNTVIEPTADGLKL